MDLYSFAKSSATKVYNKFAGNPGDLLLWTGTIGWILSSLAQASAVIFNNKIPSEQKKFLIPQELADAVVNITSFIVITRSFTKFGEHLVKSGKLATNDIRASLKELKLDANVGVKGFDITAQDEMKELNPKFNKELQKKYFDFADGVAFVSSTVGSIISSNIITPIIRNKFAAGRQKQSIAQDKMNEQNNATLSPYTPVIPNQNRVGIDDYKSKVMNASSGSMRI